MKTYTPGPWKQGKSVVENVSAGSALVCRTFSRGRFSDEHIANARLIAAAPDLLEVVKELQESAGYWSEYDVPLGIVDRINAVISKATGEA